jgi:hypothetical protein
MASTELAHTADALGDGYWICPGCGAPQSDALRCCVECGARPSWPGSAAGAEHDLGRALTWFLACIVAVLLSVWLTLALEALWIST